MNNAFLVAWRAPCLRAPSVQQCPPSSLLRIFSSEARGSRHICCDRLNVYDNFQRRLNTDSTYRPPRQSHQPARRSFGTSPAHLKRTNRNQYIKAPKANGLRVFSAAEIADIYGTSTVSTKLGNKSLRVLQQRRVEGSLDLPLPVDITKNITEDVLNKGLEWLRVNYPLDEDAAIMARIEREEQEEDDKMSRAEEQGLFKPQSGRFGAKKGKDGDVYGRSILEEIRKKNEKLENQKAEEERREWLEGEEKDKANLEKQIQQATSLQKAGNLDVVPAQPRADPKTRPFLAWVQQHHVRATFSDIEKTDKMTTAQRFLPSLGVTLLTLGLCYYYAEHYTPPSHDERRWRETPRSAATALGLIGLNAAIWVLWKFPPAWRNLNRYFIHVPMYPRALSVVGSLFSHQTLPHLAMNMFVLWFIGTQLHDEIGRGDFLALYMGTGVIASMTSLTACLLRNRLNVVGLGASGAVSGLIGTWCMLHANDKLTVTFLPHKYQEMLSMKGSSFFAAIVAFELLGALVPLRILRIAGANVSIDRWSHLGGLVSGALMGNYYWKQKHERRKQKRAGIWARYFGSS